MHTGWISCNCYWCKTNRQIVRVTVPAKHQITQINELELTFNWKCNSKQKNHIIIKPFLAKWKVDIYRKRRNFFFQLSIQPYVLFGTGPVTSTENLKSLISKTELFLSLLSVVFGLLTPKNLPYQIPRWKDD